MILFFLLVFVEQKDDFYKCLCVRISTHTDIRTFRKDLSLLRVLNTKLLHIVSILKIVLKIIFRSFENFLR